MILYLHGLDSKPNNKRIEFIEDTFETKVFAPQLDYYSSIGSTVLFSKLSELIITEKMIFIIGSSFGGYIGFHLSEYNKIPALLMNPALAKGSIVVPVLNEFNDSKKCILLGTNDDIIEPESTRKYIEGQSYENSIIIEGNYGHITPSEPFENAFNTYFFELTGIKRKSS